MIMTSGRRRRTRRRSEEEAVCAVRDGDDTRSCVRRPARSVVQYERQERSVVQHAERRAPAAIIHPHPAAIRTLGIAPITRRRHRHHAAILCATTLP